MAKLRSHAATASRLAQVWFSDIHDRQVVLDTETTGLGSDAQIIEIAIIDITGVVLLHRRIKPSVAVEDDAADIHGITLEQLKNAPTWPEVVDDVRQVLQGKTVIIYNADFDMRLLCQTSIAYRLTTGWITEIKTRCAMQLASQFFRASCDSNRWISLKRAMSLAGLAWTGNAHSAVADTQATLTLINYIENHERQILRQLEALNNP
jgi:DNA polymerase III epsilon subunit family exonuclease